MKARLMFWLRVVLATPWFLVASVVGIIFDLMRWGDPSNGSRFSNLLAAVGLPLLGIKVEVRNQERLLDLQPCVYVANHLSDADLFIYGKIYPRNTVIIGKKEVRKIPVFGFFFAGAGNILIDRADHGNAMQGMEKAAAFLQEKKLAVWVFVEGHRNLYPPMLPFKKGAFHLAVLAKVPIVPLVCEPYAHVIDPTRKMAKAGTIHIHVLEPIPVDGRSAEDLMVLARTRMEEELKQWAPPTAAVE